MVGRFPKYKRCVAPGISRNIRQTVGTQQKSRPTTRTHCRPKQKGRPSRSLAFMVAVFRMGVVKSNQHKYTYRVICRIVDVVSNYITVCTRYPYGIIRCYMTCHKTYLESSIFLSLLSMIVVLQIEGRKAGPSSSCLLRFVPCILISRRRQRLFPSSTRAELHLPLLLRTAGAPGS